jgi:hypothetical protein
VGEHTAQALSWTLSDIDRKLRRFEQGPWDAGLNEASIHRYGDRTSRFLRWPGGDYQPLGLQ